MTELREFDFDLSPEQRRQVLGEGPWLEEPDLLEYEAKGIRRIIARAPMGNLCGYAAISPGHPLQLLRLSELKSRLPVHGGLTWYQPRLPERILNPPATREGTLWVGFDCMHLGNGDLVPVLARMLEPLPVASRLLEGLTYRDLGFVRAELEVLAQEIVRLGMS